MHISPDERPVDDSTPLATLPVRALLRRPPVTVPPDLPIQATARIMREHRISSVLVARDGALVGLVTDRDLRNRVLAEGLDPARPVIEVATTALQTVDIGDHAFDALLLMARLNIHHVPVMDGRTVVGIISSTDLQQQQSNSAVNLAGAIYRQESVEELVATASRIGQLQRQLAAASTSAHAMGRIVSAMTDALTSRLLQLAEAQYGPPPSLMPGSPPDRRGATNRPPNPTRTTAWSWTTATTPQRTAPISRRWRASCATGSTPAATCIAPAR